jgi:uncharacterized protein (TIGR02246 family)
MSLPLTADDRLAIADLAARYAAAVDTRDFDRLRAVFAPGCVLDTGRSVRDGIDSVLEAMQGLLRYEATSHVLGQQVLDPIDTEADTDEVVGLTYCTAHHLMDHGDRRSDTVMHVRYHDRFVRTDDGWRIATRRLEVVWTDENPVF